MNGLIFMLNISCFVYKLDSFVFDVSCKFTELGKPDVSLYIREASSLFLTMTNTVY